MFLFSVLGTVSVYNTKHYICFLGYWFERLDIVQMNTDFVAGFASVIHMQPYFGVAW